MRLLHLHGDSVPTPAVLRAVRLMNRFGSALEHTVVWTGEAAAAGTAQLGPGLRVTSPQDFPALAGRPSLGRLHRLAQAMRGFDLVLTYGWGAIHAVLAHTLFAKALQLPPLVHHEDGAGEPGAAQPSRWRNWVHRIALGQAAALVVPTARLEQIALEQWQQPPSRVRRIADGVDVAAFRKRPRADALPRVIKRPRELWLGTVGCTTSTAMLVRAVPALPEPWQLVILGEGPERENLRRLAMELEIGHRVHLPGAVSDAAAVFGLFDLFALASPGDEAALTTLEAMAAGLAIVAPKVDALAALLSEENRSVLVRPGDEQGLAAAIGGLADDPAARTRIGAANQRRARAEFNEQAMVEAYRSVYAEALRLRRFPA